MDANDVARLRLSIGRLSRRLRVEAADEVPPLQLSTLVTLERDGPLRLGELARREAVTAPTMSRVLVSLDERNALLRRSDPADGRSVIVSLSPEGQAIIDRTRERRTEVLTRRFDRLDADQQAALRAALPALEALVEDTQHKDTQRKDTEHN